MKAPRHSGACGATGRDPDRVRKVKMASGWPKLRCRNLGTDLSQQLDCTGILAGSKRGDSTDSKDRQRLEKLGKLTRGSWVEAAIGAFGHAGDFAKDLLDPPIVALLEHAGRHAQAP